jgi:elongation factor Ts
MAEINAKDVMALRNETGLSMMECKKALTECGGDAAKAIDHLRKKLKGKMDTRTDRAAGEGRITVAVDPSGKSAVIVELRAETDFTAKNEMFLAAGSQIAQMALKAGAGSVTVTPDMAKLMDDIRIKTGENASIARIQKLDAPASTMFGTYVHHDGKKGVIVQASGSLSAEMARNICMHIVAKDPVPKGVTANDIPSDIVEKERKFRIEQAMESGKPKEIAEKMVEGGMRKFFEEIALLEQPFVMDESKKVKELLPAGATVSSFVRWQVGETA